MYINNKSETALTSRFLIRKAMKHLGVGISVMIIILGVLSVMIMLFPIYIFKGLLKIVNKFFNKSLH